MRTFVYDTGRLVVTPFTGNRSLNQMSQSVNEWAISKGWWEPAKSFGEQVALFHSELSEALEEFRNGHPPTEIYTSVDKQGMDKPEGVAVELADCIIRIMDTAAHYGIDLESAIEVKMAYNQKRPYRHGGKVY